MQKSRRQILLISISLFLGLWWFSLPNSLFNEPVSLVVEDQKGELLGARIAGDGQWRFAAMDTLPYKLSTAILAFEDKRFYRHWGIDPKALLRACWQNLKQGRIVSGASTISMQVMRLAKHNPPRTLGRKVVEMLQALRLECRYNKDSILHLWANNAPFGGNVVGATAASWRYFGKRPHLLSWAEAATLAVLPNSPGLIHPGRSRRQLKFKRDRLLSQLLTHGHIDSLSWQLSLNEPLPATPIPLPQLSPHLVDYLAQQEKTGRQIVHIDAELQKKLLDVTNRYQRLMAGNGVNNLAVLVSETATGRILAYVGNAPKLAMEHSPSVDMIHAPRSPGSLLKPLLYSLALENAQLLPEQLLLDIPSVFSGFRPENFYQQYAGVIPANQALARSLNIPFVHLLQDYGVGAFHAALQQWEFKFINKPANHYGLSLILGGCEISLWQIVTWYSGLGRTLLQYNSQILDQQSSFVDLQLTDRPFAPSSMRSLQPGPAWYTLKAMEQVERPSSEGRWEQFANSRQLAWKTGTSFGYRDAWAVGLDPQYTIGVWVGNADGEGRPGLVGVQSAAPLLFATARLLPPTEEWFRKPFDDCRSVSLCTESGFLAGPYCNKVVKEIPKSGTRAIACPYHQLIHLAKNEKFRVRRECLTHGQELKSKHQLIFPPIVQFYYQKNHPGFQSVPPWQEGCAPNIHTIQNISWIYPRKDGSIKIPIDWDGTQSASIFEVTHRQEHATVHWHLNDAYLGSTQGIHRQEVQLNPGLYQMVLVDEFGERTIRNFKVVE